MVAPLAVTLDERRRCLPESAGMDLHRHMLDPPVAIELNAQRDPAAARRRSDLRSTVLAIELARLMQRRRQAKNVGGVARVAHQASSFPRKREPSSNLQAAGPPLPRGCREKLQIIPAAKWCRPRCLPRRCPRPSARRGCDRPSRSPGWPWRPHARRCARRFEG